MKTLLALFTISTLIFASIGKVTSFKGSVDIIRDNQKILVKRNIPVETNDIISTKKDSNAIIIFDDGTIITIGKDSTLDIKEYVYDSNNTTVSRTELHFLKGAFKSVTGRIGKINPNKFTLKTKTAQIGIRGTVTLGNQEIVACTKGAISVSAQTQSINVDAGEYVTTSKVKLSPAKPLTQDILDLINAQLNTPNVNISDNSNALSTIPAKLDKMVEEKDSGGGDSSGGDGGGGH